MRPIKGKVGKMRISHKTLHEVETLSNRALSGSALTVEDLKTAVLHVRWLSFIGEGDRAESWHKFYSTRFHKNGLKMPAAGSDIRSVTSAANVAKSSGRPSTRPDYCTHNECNTCGSCPLSFGRWWDCTGRPVSGSWGVSVVNPANGEEVRTGKPADGKRVRGCYFSGGVVYKDGKKTIVPRGVSVGHSGVQ